MLLRPNQGMFAALLANAKAAHYVPFTHTEQDVVETMLPPVVRTDWANSTGVRLPRHVHLGYMWMLGTRSRVPCHNLSTVGRRSRR